MKKLSVPQFPLSEIKVSYHPKVKPSDRATVKSSQTAYELFRQAWDSDSIMLREEFLVMYLNSSAKVLGMAKLFTGGFGTVICDIRLVLALALKSCASWMIVAHNHPSGTLSPSEEDIKLTHKLIEACRLLDLRFIDHIIITSEGFLSMSDGGYI